MRPATVAVLVICFAQFVAAQETETNPPPAGVAATVNGQPLPELAVQRALKRLPPDKQAAARGELVDFLIDNILIDQYLQQLNVAVDKKEIEDKVQQVYADIKKQGQTIEKVMQELMLSDAELRAQIAAALRWDKYIAQQATDKLLADLFTNNKEVFDGTMVRARHILLTPAGTSPQDGEKCKTDLLLIRNQIDKAVEDGMAKLPPGSDKLAREIARKRLLEEAFAAKAKERSACPSKAEGGDVGWFARSGNMVEPFARAAFTLKPHQLSDVVTTQFGYHLILPTDRKPGRETKFEDVKETVKEYYAEKLKEALCARLRQASKIVINPAPKQ